MIACYMAFLLLLFNLPLSENLVLRLGFLSADPVDLPALEHSLEEAKRNLSLVSDLLLKPVLLSNLNLLKVEDMVVLFGHQSSFTKEKILLGASNLPIIIYVTMNFFQLILTDSFLGLYF